MIETVFVETDLTIAMAIVAAGFPLRNVETFLNAKGDTVISCEIGPKHNGVDASYLQSAHHGIGVDLDAKVDEITAARGITPEECIILFFSAARAGLLNRKRVINASKHRKPLIVRTMDDGRKVIFREGSDKAQVKKLIENS